MAVVFLVLFIGVMASFIWLAWWFNKNNVNLSAVVIGRFVHNCNLQLSTMLVQALQLQRPPSTLFPPPCGLWS